MSLIASKNGTNWTPAPVGKWQGVCVDVRDEGIHTNPYKDNEGNPQKPQHKISVHFQLNAPRDDSGRLPMISKWFTFSLHERASLSKFLCDWLECNYAAIPDDFDLETLVNMNARMRILHEPKSDGTGDRAVIQAIEKWEGELMAPDNFTRKPGQGSPDYQGNGTGQPAAFAPNPAQPLPATNRPPQATPVVTPNPAPPMPIAPPVDVSQMQGNGKSAAAAQHKATVKAMASGNATTPLLNAVQMKAAAKSLKMDAIKYDVELAPEPTDPVQFAQWETMSREAIDDAAGSVFDDEATPTLAGMPAVEMANTAHV